jgi:molybdopterin-binding protein
MTPDMSAGTQGVAVSAVGMRHSYRGRTVVDVDRLDLPAGGTLALLGPSGSGKSTLMRLIGLLERPDHGEVSFDGRAVEVRDRQARSLVTCVFQRPFLLRGTVASNVAYGLRLRGVREPERSRRVASALERVDLAGYGDRSALTLSGGEAQRVALARALVLQPRLLLLDEPLASLDPLVKERVMAVFRAVLATGEATVLYVTHDQDEAFMLADAVAIIREGRIVATGPLDLVMGLPNDRWLAGFVGMLESLEGQVVRSSDGLTEVDCSGTVVAAAGDQPVGTRVQLGVRPEDVTLIAGADAAGASSARNRLHGVVRDVHPIGATWRVDVSLGAVSVAASISRAALRELALAPGVPVVASFKSSAVLMRRVDETVPTTE